LPAINPDISVAIVTYQNANEIEMCIHSLQQDLIGLTAQVVIVDNASSDDTSSRLKAISDKPSSTRFNVLFFQNLDNLGFTKALNQALTRCTGDFILILNPDTQLKTPCVSILIDGLQSDNKVGVIAPQLININGTIQKSCRHFPRRRDLLLEISGLSRLFPQSQILNHWKMGAFSHEEKMYVEQPQGAFLLFSRKLLIDIGYWDETFFMFFSDVDWCYRVTGAGHKILFEPSAQAIHRKGASVYKNRTNMIFTSHRSFYDYFRKHRKNIFFANQFIGLLLLVSAEMRAFFYWLEKRATS